MDIPVFHDDQHGTAIISGAALINWGAPAEQEMLEDKRIVIAGAGAAAMARAPSSTVALGVRVET
jgi:malate dehydrogenase (oxaloacetate-decarboxylating)(NADP+)